MSKDHLFRIADLDERTWQTIDELQGSIADRYLTTSFNIYLFVVADIDDPDEVGDLDVERVVALSAVEIMDAHHGSPPRA